MRRYALFLSFGWLVFLAVLGGCGGSPAPTPAATTPEWFTDITDRSGIRHAPEASKAATYYMPTLTGGGVALFDYDKDDRLDLFFPPGGEKGGGSASQLYRQKADGSFEEVAKAAGVEIHGYGQGTAVGDVNNDGWPDLFVTAHGQVWLFRNNGNGTFADITQASGIDNPLWATSAAFVDYDRDGWLDLVVVNYIEYNSSKNCRDSVEDVDWCGPKSFNGTATRLFHNRGKAGQPGIKFDDVTITSGLASAPGPGLGVVCADFNGDRWPDLFITNDGKPNHLWLNQMNGTFKETGIANGVAYNSMGNAEANMGIAIGDINGDGLFDLFVTHLTDESHRMWMQTKRGQFRDRTAQVGLMAGASRSTGFGTLFCDFNHDGAEDLVVVNGRVKRPGHVGPAAMSDQFWSVYGERNQLYSNDGKGGFTNVSGANPALSGTPGVYRGVVVGDLDNDGAPDLVVTRLDGRAQVLRNTAPSRGHWVRVRAIDPALNRDAYGAELTVLAGGQRWTRWMNPGYSYVCSNDPRAHVGLGAADRVDEFRIVWPDGTEERFDGIPSDRSITLKKGNGRPIPPTTK